MRNRRRWILLTITCLTANLARAQTQPAAFDATLRTLLSTFERAASSENIDPAADNIDALKPHLAPEFSAVMATNRQVHNSDELRLFAKTAKSSYIGPGGKYRLQILPEASVVIGDVATASGTTEEMIVTSNGQERRYRSTWTAVFRKGADNQWQLLRLHASIDPLFNSFAVHFRTVVGRWFALGGILLGTAFGLALAWFNRWRKTRPRTAR